jgi:uncharacterized glyoxalase superfamily protein PhnB
MLGYSDAGTAAGYLASQWQLYAAQEALAAQAAAAGATIAAPPADMPWNARECTIQDPDGYRLTFSQPINMQREFSDVLEAVRKADL